MTIQIFETSNLFEIATYSVLGIEPVDKLAVDEENSRIIIYYRYNRSDVPFKAFRAGDLAVNPLALAREYRRHRENIQNRKREIIQKMQGGNHGTDRQADLRPS